MANTAEIFNFPVPDVAQKERRVADLDDGYTRIANELLEAVMLAGLTQHQLLVFLAVMRKTYGFNKKLDWVSNEQLSELTGILPHKCSAAKSVLVKRGIFIQSGRNIGINNVVSEWSTLPESGKKNKVYLKEVNLPESGKKSLPKSGIAGLPNVSELVDMVYEYCRKRGLYPDAESYPWKSNAHYWLVTNLYQNMRANALTDAELRRKAADELVHMTARINRGEAIPEPVKQLPVMGGRPLNRAQALAKIAEIKAKFGLKGASV